MKLWLLIIFLLLSFTQSRVIQVTTNNVQPIIKSLGQLHLLLHNPKCPHSKEYTQTFLQINNSNVNLGMADCSVELVLCQHLNVTHYPALMILSNHSIDVIDQDEFLFEQKVFSAENPRVVLKNIVKTLKSEGTPVTIVLEEQQLPILDKIQESQGRGVYYIKNPSKLHNALYNFVGKQLGCWILTYSASDLQRYFCGTGYRSDQLQKYLDSFSKGKLQRHVFTKETKNNYLHTTQLQQIAADLGRKTTKCKLVYFYSKQCEHCSLSDYKKVKAVLSQVKAQVDYQVQIFDLDVEQLPAGFKLPRLPQLVQFCYARSFYFGNIFTLENLKLFLSSKKEPFDKLKQNPKNEESPKNQQPPKNEQPRKNEQL